MISVRNSADFTLSRATTMVWFRLIVISVPACREVLIQVGFSFNQMGPARAGLKRRV